MYKNSLHLSYLAVFIDNDTSHQIECDCSEVIAVPVIDFRAVAA